MPPLIIGSIVLFKTIKIEIEGTTKEMSIIRFYFSCYLEDVEFIAKRIFSNFIDRAEDIALTLIAKRAFKTPRQIQKEGVFLLLKKARCSIERKDFNKSYKEQEDFFKDSYSEIDSDLKWVRENPEEANWKEPLKMKIGYWIFKLRGVSYRSIMFKTPRQIDKEGHWTYFGKHV